MCIVYIYMYNKYICVCVYCTQIHRIIRTPHHPRSDEDSFADHGKLEGLFLGDKLCLDQIFFLGPVCFTRPCHSAQGCGELSSSLWMSFVVASQTAHQNMFGKFHCGWCIMQVADNCLGEPVYASLSDFQTCLTFFPYRRRQGLPDLWIQCFPLVEKCAFG